MSICDINISGTLTAEESAILNSYRKLNNKGKAVLLQRTVELTQINSYTSNVTYLDVFKRSLRK